MGLSLYGRPLNILSIRPFFLLDTTSKFLFRCFYASPEHFQLRLIRVPFTLISHGFCHMICFWRSWTIPVSCPHMAACRTCSKPGKMALTTSSARLTFPFQIFFFDQLWPSMHISSCLKVLPTIHVRAFSFLLLSHVAFWRIAYALALHEQLITITIQNGNAVCLQEA